MKEKGFTLDSLKDIFKFSVMYVTGLLFTLIGLLFLLGEGFMAYQEYYTAMVVLFYAGVGLAWLVAAQIDFSVMTPKQAGAFWASIASIGILVVGYWEAPLIGMASFPTGGMIMPANSTMGYMSTSWMLFGGLVAMFGVFCAFVVASTVQWQPRPRSQPAETAEEAA